MRAYLNDEYPELARDFGTRFVDFIGTHSETEELPVLKEALTGALISVGQKERAWLMEEDNLRDISLGLIAQRLPDDLQEIIKEKDLTGKTVDITATLVLRDVCTEMLENTVYRDSNSEGKWLRG